MENHFQTRVLRPLFVTLGVLLAMIAFIGLIAATLLWNTHTNALWIAALVAGGILFVVSLVTTRDRLEGPQRAVALLAVALPVLGGGAYALGVVGDIADEQRLINVEPLLVIPEDAPLIAAENSTEFCLPAEEGDACEPTDTWEADVQSEEQWAYLFRNLDAGVLHNVSIFELAGSAEDPEAGAEVFTGQNPFPGVAEEPGVVEPGLEPGEFYFRCDVHPVMEGVLTVTAAEEA